jgi:hypothetical protein
MKHQIKIQIENFSCHKRAKFVNLVEAAQILNQLDSTKEQTKIRRIAIEKDVGFLVHFRLSHFAKKHLNLTEKLAEVTLEIIPLKLVVIDFVEIH